MNHVLIKFRTRVSFIGLVLICSVCSLQSSAQQAVDPQEKPVALKALEIGKATDKAMVRVLGHFAETWDAKVPLYIINYGSDQEINRREKLLINIRWPQPYERARMTIVRGGSAKGPRTVIWKVPYGADNPAP